MKNLGTKSALLVGIAALLFLACNTQGETCNTDDDCGSNLTCTPILGRANKYCCPTPAESSDYTNCHATATGPENDTTPTGEDAAAIDSGATTEDAATSSAIDAATAAPVDAAPTTTADSATSSSDASGQ